MAKRDYYEILGVPRNASDEDLNQAFRKLAKRYHPDINPGDAEAELKFREANEAHQELSDPQKREAYNRYGSTDSNAQQRQSQRYGTGNDDFTNLYHSVLRDLFGAPIFGDLHSAFGSAARSTTPPPPPADKRSLGEILKDYNYMVGKEDAAKLAQHLSDKPEDAKTVLSTLRLNILGDKNSADLRDKLADLLPDDYITQTTEYFSRNLFTLNNEVPAIELTRTLAKRPALAEQILLHVPTDRLRTQWAAGPTRSLLEILQKELPELYEIKVCCANYWHAAYKDLIRKLGNLLDGVQGDKNKAAKVASYILSNSPDNIIMSPAAYKLRQNLLAANPDAYVDAVAPRHIAKLTYKNKADSNALAALISSIPSAGPKISTLMTEGGFIHKANRDLVDAALRTGVRPPQRSLKSYIFGANR